MAAEEEDLLAVFDMLLGEQEHNAASSSGFQL